MKRRVLSSFLICVSLASIAQAQGVQTGTLTGTLKSSDGVALPDATVTVTSRALQGERSTTSDVNGVYVLPNLPPGTYTLKISKAGLASLERTATIPLGGTATVDATLALATVSESVVVQGVIPPPVTDIQTSANIQASEINVLPMGRTPYLVTELMPGVTTNTPNANQVTISGGFAYDNVFLIDGVDVNDNLLGTSNDLFIEDAIGEVQVLTSGVSAEYGRFSGGVVNIITKSGGNMFSGSYRTNFTRPSWTKETPFETANGIQRGKPTAANPFITNKLSTFTELTGGGPAVKDRLWFFGAGRFENSSTAGHAAADGDSLHEDEPQQAIRSQGHRLVDAGPDAAGHLHRQPRASRQRAGAVVQHRQGDVHLALDAEPARRGELQRRAVAAHARERAVFAEALRDPGRRRHGDGDRRLAVPDAHRHAVSVQRAAVRRERPGTAQQPPVDGQPELFPLGPDGSAATSSRAASKTSSTRASAPTRRRRPATCSRRTSRWTQPACRCSTPAAGRFRCSRLAARAWRSGSRIAAPSST